MRATLDQNSEVGMQFGQICILARHNDDGHSEVSVSGINLDVYELFLDYLGGEDVSVDGSCAWVSVRHDAREITIFRPMPHENRPRLLHLT